MAAALVLLLASPSVAAVREREPASTPAPASTSVPSTTPPAVAQAPRDTAADSAYADPSRALGATSPSCRYQLDAVARRSCQASGSVASPHPLSAYGMDVRVGFSITDPGKSFLSALQSVAAAVWMGLLWLIKGVLLLLEWAFSLDLTRQGMPKIRETLARLQNQAFGDWWLLLAISIAGLWGMWRGLVQRRATETLAGLAATIALIVGGLVIIARPEDTVGRAAQAANETGLAVLAAASGQPVDQPRTALAGTLRRVFSDTVRDPWCALEFGSIDYCDEATGDRRLSTNAELWLAYPAQSWQRGRLHTLMKPPDHGGISAVGIAKRVLGIGGEDRKLPGDVEDLVRDAPNQARMQDAGGTFPRLALLLMILVGLLGAGALYAYLGVRLLLAAGMTLVLLLIAPAMLLAPAVGDSGRATFIGWIKRLVGAIAAKLIYAVLLAVVLAASRVFTGLDIGWFGTWLLSAAFWWGVFIKRHEIIKFVSAGTPHTHGDGISHALSHGYYAWMLGRGLSRAGARAAAPGRAGASALRTRRQEGQAARTAATGALAREQLDDRHRHVLYADQQHAREVVADRDRLQQELRAADRRLAGYDDAVTVAHASNGKPPKATPEQRQLLEHRQGLRVALAAPALQRAEQTVRHADRNTALTGDSVTSKDLDIHRARRARQLRELSDDPDQLITAAGIDPEVHRAAEPDERQRIERDAAARLGRERDLHEAAQSNGHSTPSTVAAARRWIRDEDLRKRTDEERARIRAERRQRRLTNGRFRVR
jgi:hypothetical protein